MHMKQKSKTLIRSLIVGCLLTITACTFIGCSNNQAVESENYKKLPPGEGARRLQDTLKRRAEGRPRTAPLPPDAAVDQSK